MWFEKDRLNEDILHILYLLLLKHEWGRRGTRIGRLLVGKPEGKRPLGRPRRSWVDNIRMDLGEAGWGDVDWIGLARIGTGGELL
jgi:hypothetical protein